MAQPPVHPPTSESEMHQLIGDLVSANHILYNTQVLDAFGHISARDPDHADRFLLARSMAPALVGAADIVTYDLDGNALGGDTRRGYVERYIHSEIYRARPDVMAIVHSHCASVLPFACSSVPLRPVFHMAGFLKRISRFEIREVAGDATDMLVRDAEIGRYLAQGLSANCVSLMRGHGMVVVGRTIQEAVYRSVYTEANERVQMQGATLGAGMQFLSDNEADAADHTASGQYGRSWDLWKAQAALSE